MDLEAEIPKIRRDLTESGCEGDDLVSEAPERDHDGFNVALRTPSHIESIVGEEDPHEPVFDAGRTRR